LYAWCKAAEAHGEEAFPGKGHQLPLEEEIHRDPTRMRAGSTGARHLKKSHQHLLAHPAMKYAFVAEHCRDYPVTVLCCVLEVSVSGYYAWRKREPSQHSREDAALAAKVETAFENNRRVYGSPRIPGSNCKHKVLRVVKNVLLA
jgi:putative transposase